MTNEQNSITLNERFRNIKDQYDPKHLKYIHSKTVDNLLYHTDSFSLNHHKDQVHLALSKYFDTIEVNYVNNISTSLELFNKYIRPLTKLFSDLKGFHLTVKFWIISSWTIPIFIFLYFVGVPIYFYVGLAIIYIVVIIRNYYFDSNTMG